MTHCRNSNPPKNGKIIAALINGEDNDVDIDLSTYFFMDLNFHVTRYLSHTHTLWSDLSIHSFVLCAFPSIRWIRFIQFNWKTVYRWINSSLTQSDLKILEFAIDFLPKIPTMYPCCYFIAPKTKAPAPPPRMILNWMNDVDSISLSLKIKGTFEMCALIILVWFYCCVKQQPKNPFNE